MIEIFAVGGGGGGSNHSQGHSGGGGGAGGVVYGTIPANFGTGTVSVTVGTGGPGGPPPGNQMEHKVLMLQFPRIITYNHYCKRWR